MKSFSCRARRIFVSSLVFIFAVSLVFPVGPARADVGLSLNYPTTGIAGDATHGQNLYWGSAFYTNSNSYGSLMKLQTNVGSTYTDRFRIDRDGNVTASGNINAAGGLCMNGDCKANWASVGSSQWTTSGSNIYNANAGNVGIGTNNPTGAKLVVEPTVAASADSATIQGGFTSGSDTHSINAAFYAKPITVGSYDLRTRTFGLYIPQLIANTSHYLVGNQSGDDSGQLAGIRIDNISTTGGLSGLAWKNYGIWIKSISSNTSDAQQFGLKIDSITGGGAENYGLYIAGGSKNYFGGNVGIGVSSPARALDLGTGGNSITFGNAVDVGAAERGVYWHSGNGYGIYKTAGSWSSPNYQQLQLAFSTGIVIDGGYSYGKSGTVIQPSNGNVGIGSGISSWHSSFLGLNLGSSGSIMTERSGAGDLRLFANAYYDGSYKYLVNGYATGMWLDSAAGAVDIQAAPSGSSGGAISWSSTFHISNNGNVGIGVTNPAAKLAVNGAIRSLTNPGSGIGAAGFETYDETSGTLWQIHSHGDRIRTYNGSTEYTYVAGGDSPSFGSLSLSDNLNFSNITSGRREIRGVMGDNDYWSIGGVPTGSNAGVLEIATGDDGQAGGSAEPIVVRQYGPGAPWSGTLVRSAYLLDSNGNTSFPGNTYISGKVGVGMSNPGATLHVAGSIGATDWIGAGCEAGYSCDNGGGYVLNYADGHTDATGYANYPSYRLGGGTSYGVGVVNWASGRFDTVDSGSSDDVLELNYYNGSDVRIGDGSGQHNLHVPSGGLSVGSDANLSSGYGYFSGRVGIGTDSPVGTLELYGSSPYASVVWTNPLSPTDGKKWVWRVGCDGGSDPNCFGFGAITDAYTGGNFVMKSYRNSGATTINYTNWYADHNFVDGRVGIGVSPSTYGFKLSAVDSSASSDYPAIYGKHAVTNYYGVGVRGEAKWKGIDGICTADGGTWCFGGDFTAYSGATNSVGVRASGYTYDFYAAGNGVDYGTASSKRWKKNIIPIDNALDKVMNMRGVYFDWDKEHGGNHAMGMIAEEVGKQVPEVVAYEPNGVDASGMDYGKLTPVLVNAIKEQQAQIEELKKEIELLKKESGK